MFSSNSSIAFLMLFSLCTRVFPFSLFCEQITNMYDVYAISVQCIRVRSHETSFNAFETIRALLRKSSSTWRRAFANNVYKVVQFCNVLQASYYTRKVLPAIKHCRVRPPLEKGLYWGAGWHALPDWAGFAFPWSSSKTQNSTRTVPYYSRLSRSCIGLFPKIFNQPVRVQEFLTHIPLFLFIFRWYHLSPLLHLRGVSFAGLFEETVST